MKRAAEQDTQDPEAVHFEQVASQAVQTPLLRYFPSMHPGEHLPLANKKPSLHPVQAVEVIQPLHPTGQLLQTPLLLYFPRSHLFY